MAGIWESLTVDDMPNEELRWMARSLGMDVAVKVWQRFAGNHVKCPAKIPPKAVRRYMKDHFDKRVHEIAIAAGVHDRTIYRYMDYQPSRDPSQTCLF